MNTPNPGCEYPLPDEEIEGPDRVSQALFKESVMTLIDTQGGTLKAITEDTNAAEQVLAIEALVRGIQNSAGTLFEVGLRHGRLTLIEKSRPLSRQIREAVGRSDQILVRHFPFHAFNPPVDLFLRHKGKLSDDLARQRMITQGIDRSAYPVDGASNLNGCELIDLVRLPSVLRSGPAPLNDDGVHVLCNGLNAFVTGIREECASAPFKLRLRRFQYGVSKNRKSLLAYVDHLFDRTARLLVIRLDLSYTSAVSPSQGGDQAVDFQQARDDRNRFLRSMRSNPLFEGLVGYGWKLEYGLEKGFHFHCLFFFNGAERQQDVWLAEAIGEHWKDTVGGNGLYWNCNARKEDYRRLGIGLIDHWDYEKRLNLQQPIDYLTKPDLHLKLVAPNSQRTFGKGEIRTSEGGRKGRPRVLGREAAAMNTLTFR